MTARIYCTILSRNYLPKALALAESLRRHEDGAVLRILLIDTADQDQVPTLAGVECLSTATLGLSHAEVLRLATTYDLVEFATAVKPLLLKAMLEQAEQAVYLDPDTYVISPMVELGPALKASAGGILLTPHFLHPPRADAEFREGHMLLLGVNNLGFCAVDRRAGDCLDWWWDRLREQCLYDPIAGLFVDQKWMDIGSSLFQAATFRHAGYNVGVSNLSERPITRDADGLYIESNGDRLRLFHFHAFDPRTPEKLSVRFAHSSNDLANDNIMFQLCKEYAECLIAYEHELPEPPPYPYTTDSQGHQLSDRVRRAYLQQSGDGTSLPSPFVPADAAAFNRWRRRAWRSITRTVISDSAKSARHVFHAEYKRAKKRYPKVAARLADRFAGGAGIWDGPEK